MKPLDGKVAVVAGATRGAGRGIACMLGEPGATVYCTGRSTKKNPSEYNRPETIEDTAEMVTAHGGHGIWVRTDHTQPDQVEALFERIAKEQDGRLDILVNDMTGDGFAEWGKRLWEHDLSGGLQATNNGVTAHIITSHYGLQLMVKQRQGLLVEVNDGNGLVYNGNFYYSFNKSTAILMAYFLAMELKEFNIAAVSITPGYLRSEAMLDSMGLTEETWEDGIKDEPIWADSETPFYVGRAVAALAADPNVMDKTGRALSSGWLARDFGFTDVDGRQPPGYNPKEGVFTPRKGFELQAQGLSGGEQLLSEEIRAIAQELSIPGAERERTSLLIEEIQRMNPKRLD
ncbi:MAG: SDR family NAD(P)-dependent oxidoreductase [Candidatus Latescibacteria bacterium]|nr:SDR family NAD(P)-dependent oxidoreductase [Candidatus Latescibacterota bacterium]